MALPHPALRLTLAATTCLTLAATLAGCSGTDLEARGGRDGAELSAPRAEQDRSLLTPYGLPAPRGSSDGTVRGGVVETDAGAGDSVELAAPTMVPSAAAGAAPGPAGSGAGAADGGVTATDVSDEALKAGFVDDNAEFAAYESYCAAYDGPSRDLPLAGRHVVTVTDLDGMPLLGAAVTVGGSTALSHVDGRTLFFGVKPGDEVGVTYAGATATATVGQDLVTRVAVDTTRSTGRLTLDLDLVLDTTGSMGDEISRLNDSLDDVATRLGALPSHPTVRYALTVYRDHQDAYVFRSHDFTDLETFRAELAKTTADGGGDTPEALDEAFHGAVMGPSWGQDTTSVEMMLLVADAPSHIKGGGAAGYVADVAEAGRRGIEVVPLGASDTDDTAEYQFRQLAQQTLGTFFFLTYDADGSPGESTTTHVKGYRTGDLGDMIVDHVSARLASYDVPVGQAPPTPSPTPTPSSTGDPTPPSQR